MAMSIDCAKGTESTMYNLIFLAEHKAQDDDDFGRGEWCGGGGGGSPRREGTLFRAVLAQLSSIYRPSGS